MENRNFWYTTLCVALIVASAVENGPLLRLALLLCGGLLIWNIIRRIKEMRG